MRSIDFEDAKTIWGALLDEVQQGAVVIITRAGERVARLVPPDREHDREAARAAVERIRKRRVANRADPPITIEEILALRDEGRP